MPSHTHPQSSTPADSHGNEDRLQPGEDHLPGGPVPVGHTEPEWEQTEEKHDEGGSESHLDCKSGGSGGRGKGVGRAGQRGREGRGGEGGRKEGCRGQGQGHSHWPTVVVQCHSLLNCEIL